MEIISFLIGFFLGGGLTAVAGYFFIKSLKLMQSQLERSKETVTQTLKESFESLSYEALNKNTQSLLDLSETLFKKQQQSQEKELSNKKALIDQRLEGLDKHLAQLYKSVQSLETERAKTFSNLQAQLKASYQQANLLTQSTNRLQEVLSNSKRRGQWGERMAEDVLRLTGLKEGINYVKQKAVSAFETQSRAIPDFTFILPNGIQVNMDVKFPLTNYMAYMDAESEIDKEKKRLDFMKDVRLRMKEVTSKDYIHEKTVDYVLIFIPNEQVYAFMNEQDLSLIEDALSRKVVFCSPLTLYAMLAIIDRASKDFVREKRAEDIIQVLRQFQAQWEKFNEVLAKMGRRLDDALKEFQVLTTTRKNQLEKPLQSLDHLVESKQEPSTDSTQVMYYKPDPHV